MKKIWITIVSILILAFIIITISKKKSPEADVESGKTVDEKQRGELNSFWGHYREATAFRIEGEWNKAIEKYQMALEINPQHEDAIYYLGNMHLETENDLGAEKSWLKLLELNPESSRAHYQLGNLYMNPLFSNIYNLDKAKTEFETTFAINKDFIQPLIQLGQISLFNGDLVKSKEYFLTVLGSDKKNIPSNYLTGYILWKQGNKSKGLEYFKEACRYSIPEELSEGISNEGDTKDGKSLERQVNESMFQSYFIDLSRISDSDFSDEMTSRYQKLESFLDR